MYKRQVTTLLKKQENQVPEANAEAKHLHAKKFTCEADALAAAANLEGTWPLLKASEPQVSSNTVNKSGARGRPKAGDQAKVFSVGEQDCKKLGKFMLATNDLTLNDEQIFQAYKQQQTVERGFRFLKNGDFQLTPVRNPAASRP